jgi:chromosome partitioning protein
MEQREQPIPLVAAFSANKGGVGKTREALLIANCLGAAGRRVLVVDMDFNNSATFYYLPGDLAGAAGEKNIAAALSRESNLLADYAIPTGHKGVDLIASSRYLADLRSISEKRLGRMIPALAGKYDLVVIDCQPDYNNLTLNAINASDLIITPVLKDLDSFNAAAFLGQKIALDTDKQENWYITINGYNRHYEEASGGKQKEYIDVYRSEFSRITDPATWFPWTADMNEIKDRKKRLSDTPLRGEICNPELYHAVISLSEFLIQEPFENPGAF